MLSIAFSLGLPSPREIIRSKQMPDGRLFHTAGLKSYARGINAQWELYPCLNHELSRMFLVAKPNRHDPGAGVLDFLVVFAQLRNMLSTKHSAIVPQKNDQSYLVLPDGAKT